jgi:hypothetical protein
MAVHQIHDGWQGRLVDSIQDLRLEDTRRCSRRAQASLFVEAYRFIQTLWYVCKTMRDWNHRKEDRGREGK